MSWISKVHEIPEAELRQAFQRAGTINGTRRLVGLPEGYGKTLKKRLVKLGLLSGKPRTKRYSDEDVIEAVREGTSIRGVLNQLGIVGIGGNYRTLKRAIKRLGLSITHFTGQAHLKGKTHNWAPKIPLNQILVENSTYASSDKLRRRLIGEEVLEAKCSICNRTEWMEKNIPLELDHVNGKNTDNRLENLRLVCPNCHAQTVTYRGKNKGKE